VERPAVVTVDLGAEAPLTIRQPWQSVPVTPLRGGRRAGDHQGWPRREAARGGRRRSSILLGQEVVEGEAPGVGQHRARDVEPVETAVPDDPAPLVGRRGRATGPAPPQAASTAAPARVKTIRRIFENSALIEEGIPPCVTA